MFSGCFPHLIDFEQIKYKNHETNIRFKQVVFLDDYVIKNSDILSLE